MGKVGDGVAVHLQVDGDGRAAQLGMGGGGGVGLLEPAQPGDVAGQLQDPGVVAVVQPWPKSPLSDKPLSDHVRSAPQPVAPKPSREDALAAVRTLIAYAGDNPDREGLLDTPKRVIEAYQELYRGYRESPIDVL